MTSASPPISSDLQQPGQELQRHADAYAVPADAVTSWTHSISRNGGPYPGQRMTYVAGVQTSAILRIAEAHRELYHDTPCDICTSISDALAALVAAQRILEQDQIRERTLQVKPRTRWGTRRRSGTGNE